MRVRLAAAMVGVLLLVARAQAHQQNVPRPFADQVHDACPTAYKQAELNVCADAAAAKYDRDLEAVYQAALTAMPSKHDRTRFARKQESWKASRAAFCKRDAVQAVGPTDESQPMVLDGCMSKLAAVRMEALRH